VRYVSAALSPSCTIAALVFLVCLALLGIPGSVCAGEQPDWLKKDTIDRLFPEAIHTGPRSGEPPAIPVYGAGGPIGFLFSTAELTDVVGFSGAPFNFVVGLDLQGKIVGVVLVEHAEPIIDYSSLGGQLTRFIEQYAGLDLGGSISLSGQGTPGGIDGISSATVSARAFNNAIVQSARLVARSWTYGWRRVDRHGRYRELRTLDLVGAHRGWCGRAHPDSPWRQGGHR
jgi:transcriptional regulator of nitric oxide reductase